MNGVQPTYTTYYNILKPTYETNENNKAMRLHAGPGRGGRGLPWLVKPKYLLHKPLYATLQKDCADPNNFYGVLETIEENTDNTNAKDQWKKGSEDETTCKQKQRNLYDQRKMCEKIPNSKNLTVGIIENKIAPDIENKTFDFTTVVRKKRKKKYNAISPAQYYKNKSTTHKLESNTIKSKKIPKCWITMNDNLQEAEARLENMNTQDIDMEVENMADESIRLQLWKEIEHISAELDRPIREKSR